MEHENRPAYFHIKSFVGDQESSRFERQVISILGSSGWNWQEKPIVNPVEKPGRG
jgi:hypothetical protein